MRESLLERFGFWLAIGLVALFAWRLISTGLHESEAFALLFPLNWIEYTSVAPVVRGFLAPYQEAQWWVWVEVAVTVLLWMFLYFVARGIFYTVVNMEGKSLWVGFLLCLLLIVGFFGVVLSPFFEWFGHFREAKQWWQDVAL